MIDLAGLAEERSVLVDPTPLVVRAEDAMTIDPGQLARRLRTVPTVTVVVGAASPAVGAAFDVSVESAADVAHVAAAVERHPLAALGLVALLRATEGADTWAGLAAESATYATLLGGREFKAWLQGRGPTRPCGEGPRTRRIREGDVLHVTLARPEAHNAFDRRMRDELVEALQLGAADETITSVVLDGDGPSFCSGGDLDEFGAVIDPPTAHAVRLSRHPAWWMEVCAGRVVAHLHGACIGAGIELPAFARRVVASPDAFFELPEVGMGLVPGAGGTVSIARRIGRQRCAWLALTGDRIDAATALEWGLIDELSPRAGGNGR